MRIDIVWLSLVQASRACVDAAAGSLQARPAEDHADRNRAHREGDEDEGGGHEDEEFVHGQALSDGSAAKAGVERSARPSPRRSMK